MAEGRCLMMVYRNGFHGDEWAVLGVCRFGMVVWDWGWLRRIESEKGGDGVGEPRTQQALIEG